MAQKIALKILAYIVGNGINNKIGLADSILGQHKVIKKLLERDKTSTVYIRKMQEIYHLPAYTISLEQTISIEIFIDN